MKRKWRKSDYNISVSAFVCSPGDVIAESLLMYSGQEKLNPRMQDVMAQVGEGIAGVQDYRESQVFIYNFYGFFRACNIVQGQRLIKFKFYSFPTNST